MELKEDMRRRGWKTRQMHDRILFSVRSFFARRGFLRILYVWDEGAIARPNSDTAIND